MPKRILVWAISFATISLFEFGELQALSLKEAVAYAWAPIYFKDFAHEFTNSKTGFNPVDHPVDLFFDGNEDVRDNHKNVFKLDEARQKKALERVPVYYSVIETSTHFYINYFIYHAIDLNNFGHAHDTENIWTIVEKDGTPYGSLVMQLANAHGFPMIYGPNVSTQSFWRKQVAKDHMFKVFKEMDRFSADHHSEGAVEYVKRAVSKSLKVFVSSKTHAQYKFNSRAWAAGKGYGSVYYPPSCLECQTAAESMNRVNSFEYELVSWDKLFFKLLEKEPKVFIRQSLAPARELGQLKLKLLPDHMNPGENEPRARVNLFHVLSFKTPYPLGFPAKVHSWLSGSRKGISQDYVFNPYIERRNDRRRSSWSLISDIAD